jgi:hypothetical protein
MLRKYALVGILGVTLMLALSAFIAVGRQPVVNSGAASVAACLSDNANPRFAHVWNGIYVPSVDTTDFLTLPTLACFPADAGSNFRTAHLWNGFYIPSIDATGYLSDQ